MSGIGVRHGPWVGGDTKERTWRQRTGKNLETKNWKEPGDKELERTWRQRTGKNPDTKERTWRQRT